MFSSHRLYHDASTNSSNRLYPHHNPIDNKSLRHHTTQTNPRIQRTSLDRSSAAPALLPHIPAHMRLYHVLKLENVAIIIPSPPLETISTSVLHGAGRRRRKDLSRAGRDLRNAMGTLLRGCRLYELASAHYISISMRLGTGQRRLRFDFLLRFGETMQLWATNGFKSRYDVIVEKVLRCGRSG